MARRNPLSGAGTSGAFPAPIPTPRLTLIPALIPALMVALVLGACGGDDGEDSGDTGVPESSVTTGAGGPTTTVAGEGGAFSLLSYNVAGLPQEVSGENPKDHLPLISPLLDDYDLVVTQEDFDWWVEALAGLDFVNYHERLRAETTHAHRNEIHPGPDAVGIDGSDPARPMPLVGDGLGVLSRFQIADVERVPWPHCFGGADTSDGGAGDCLAMKGFLATTVTLADGVEVDVYTLHVEAGEGPDDQPLQAEDVNTLAAYMAQRSAGRAVVVAGDTNLHLEPGHDQEAVDRPLWEGFLEELGLTDVCSVVTCAEEGTIDKVAWRDGDGLRLEPVEFRWEGHFVDAAGEDLSDHPAVAVDWVWQAG